MPVATPVPRATLSPKQARAMLARRTLAARGYLDCVTFSFTDRATARLFAPSDVAARWDQQDTLAVANPIASDLDHMRATPLATLAQAASRNAARGYADVALAEVGPGLHGTGTDDHFQMAAGLRAGGTPRHWQAPARAVDMMDAKADLWVLLAALGVPLDALTVAADATAAPHLHPGRHGVVRQGPKGPPLATFGELHPRVLRALDLAGPAAAFELFLDRVPEPKRRRKQAPEIPAFQPVARDFAFVVDADVPAEAVLRAARGAERALISGVSLFDRYAGANLPPGKVSLAIAVTFQPRERTLTDAEIEAACGKVVAAVTKATGAALR
jgi:phenylalanyl-tRNA synthetase beta chain